MSLLVGNMGEFLTFNEFLMSEAIEPIKIQYGNNPPEFNNSELIKFSGGNIWGICFVYDTKLYAVQLHRETGEIAFDICLDIPTNTLEFNKSKFTDSKIATKSALKVFNYVFFVLLKLLETNKHNVFFNAANNELNTFYRILTTNKYFNIKLKEYNFSGMYLEDDKYKINYKGK
jgi:hypothetical protein